MPQKYGKQLIFAKMKAFLALDSFKGSLSSREAVLAASEAFSPGDAVLFPLSDGGEGFTECIVESTGGFYRTIPAHDALGRPIRARYGWIRDGRTAVLETAAASGLVGLESCELDPFRASSYGTGELICDAIREGAREIWIGLGGTAVMDGGAGMLRALSTVPVSVPIHAFYDADVPLTGPGGAAAVFGPQKGADAEGIRKLENRFRRLAEAWKASEGVDVDRIPGAGAAGGIGAALAVCLHARMHAGIGSVLRILGFADKLAGCDLVITGEGKADRQTLTGKAAYGLLKAVREQDSDIPVILLAGQVEERESLLAAGFDAVLQITPEIDRNGTYLNKEIAQENLRHAVFRLLQGFPNLRNQH